MLSTLAILACLVYAAGQPCQGTFPKCPTQGASTDGCAYPNAWDLGDEEPMSFYACNGTSSDCPNSPGNCNIMVRYDGTGRICTCEPAGWQAACMSSHDGGHPLNVKCDDGTKCNPNGPTDTIPPLIPPTSGTNVFLLPKLAYTWEINSN
ncbi:MAG TPA: hypothetical protein VG820_13445 [Fimbriimonadaceae bacterium]|nr:hypothetical protein [Fimbriimonadaceae bacterium]